MFERTKVDNSQDGVAVAAAVELDDGSRVSGRFLVPRSKSVIEMLNGAAVFVDFEPFDGERQVIAKSAIRSLRLISAPAGRDPARLIQADAFDPYEILGLEKGASRAEVRAAFLQLAKRYHPDRYSTAELPAEVADYLQAMARRVNAAYEVLADEAQRREAFAAQRTDPVYQSSRPGF